MTEPSSAIFDDIIARGCIGESDVLELRHELYRAPAIREAQAEGLMRLEQVCAEKDASWPDLYVEALTDYIVVQMKPEGYITHENAEWLKSRIGADGIVSSATELELVLSVLDKARWSPPSLSAFALAQVRHAVISGSGPLRNGLALSPGLVCDADVALLRRVLHAFGGDGNIAVTRAEAEVLFDINDATSGAANHPSWSDLFVKAIAGVVMAASGYQVPSREEALAEDAFLERRGELGPGRLIGQMLTGGLSRIRDLYRESSAEERALARLEQQRLEIIVNEQITTEEADWLAQRIGRDETVSTNERVLLEFMACEAPSLPPALKELVAKAGRAA